MVMLHKREKPIGQEPLDPEQLRKALESLQGNILKGHGRDHAIHIFLHFTKGQEDRVKRWIKGLAKRITSAQRQLDEAEQYRNHRIPGRLFLSFFLSAPGYKYLQGIAPDLEIPHDDVFSENFRRGMQAFHNLLHDPPRDQWDEEYRQPIHAMVLLADNDEPFLLREARKLLDHVKVHADIRAVEQGRVMRNAQGNPIEHFGYVDGRSNPLFFASDIEQERQLGDGTHVWDPGAGPKLVLEQDPNGREGYDCGSYLVFRKLEQDVQGFRKSVQKLADALGVDEQRAGALVIGRFEDGTPVVLQNAAGGSNPVPNNFTYKDDPHGLKCPFHAHIRKVNPRESKDPRKPNQRSPRIVRRGIPYGKREKEPKDNPSLKELPTKGNSIGILFMCYQSNIMKQFCHLQSEWANKPTFPRDGTGIDPIIGQPAGSMERKQQWRAQWGNPQQNPQSFDFSGFVTLKGGEFFFAPSIYFLKTLTKSR